MAEQLSIGRKMLLGLLVAALVLAITLGAGELLLRVVGYGHDTAFPRAGRTPDGAREWRENRWVTAPYFPPALIRRPQPMRLARPKPPGTYRIFVLGSSAAMGDPEPAFAFGRQLELLLQQAYPAQRFEVVNAGITAINSHVVRAIAGDCAELEPDLFIVYEGHNEVIGPYGPGTVFSPFFRTAALIRLNVTLKSARLGQLATALVGRLGPQGDSLADWGGMQMFLKHEIARDDPRLAATAELFRDNLRAIAAAGRRAGAVVFVCTTLTNQKDFAPFRSQHRPDLTEVDRQAWEELFAAGERAAVAGDDATAETKFRAALARDDRYAELAFQLGRLCLRTNRVAEARAFFQQALDLDTLRFRADSRLNQVVRDLPRSEGLEVVDLAAVIAQRSPQGLLGDELLYEHVHLNFQGNYEVARALFADVSADLVRRKLISGAAEPSALLSVAEVRRRLAYTSYEQAMIIKELAARFAGAPFTGQSDNAARRKLFAQREEVALRLLAQPGTPAALAAHYEEALAARPDDWLLARNAGMALVALGLPERGRPPLERVATLLPDDPDTLFGLATAYQKVGDAAAAEKYFAALRALEPRYPGVPPARKP